jgi:putative aldouronate transport system permease protein
MYEKLGFKKELRARTIFVIINIAFFILLMMVILLPLIKVLVDSFDKRASTSEFRLFPKEFSLDSYMRIVKQPWLFRPFIISVVTTIGGTLIAMFVTTLFAYVLTKKDMPLRNLFMYLTLFTMIFRGGMIPLYLVIKNLHLYNTLWAIMLPTALDAYYLILLRNFFSSIPMSLIEAAEIEGCSPFKVFYFIVLPLSKASLAAISLFNIVKYWNTFFPFVIYIRDEKLWNFQTMLRNMVLENETVSGVFYDISFESLKNAAVIVVIIPVLILYPVLQKYFVKGVNLGSIKG